MELDSKKLFTLASAAVSGFFVLKSFIYDPWKPINIIKLIIYPIKSLPGVEVDRLEVLEAGAKYQSFRDRCLTLLDDENRCVTQRTYPKLALIRLRLEGDDIVLDADNMTTLRIPNDFSVTENPLIDFQLWGEDCQGYVCPEEMNQWFTNYLGIPIRMVKFVDGLKQDKSKIPDTDIDANCKAFYQDFFPLMLINQTSIDDLNERLDPRNRVSYRNFRPNILVKTFAPFEEDQWSRIEINGIPMRMPKPCDRCLLTTVNPDRGEKSPDNEPLRTLRTYRMKPELSKRSPFMGINLVPLISNGDINVGNKIVILERF